MDKWIALAIGGFAGTFARYSFSGFLYNAVGSDFPYGTLAVNLVGCFLIGILAVLSEEKFFLTPNARLLLMVGFCGAFTTFSTFILETGNIIRDGDLFHALLYVVGSVVLGFIVFRFGVFLGKVI